MCWRGLRCVSQQVSCRGDDKAHSTFPRRVVCNPDYKRSSIDSTKPQLFRPLLRSDSTERLLVKTRGWKSAGRGRPLRPTQTKHIGLRRGGVPPLVWQLCWSPGFVCPPSRNYIAVQEPKRNWVKIGVLTAIIVIVGAFGSCACK
jgi:hypothetical protein